MKTWLIAIIALVVMIGFMGTTHDASAAIFHSGNSGITLLVEDGDTLTSISRNVVKDYNLSRNIGACTKALVRDIHGVSWEAYLRNSRKYDRNFREGQVYELPAECTTKLQKISEPVVKQKTVATPTQISVTTEQPKPTTQEAAIPEFPTHYSIQPIVASIPATNADERFRSDPTEQILACVNGITGEVVWSLESIPSDLRNAVYQTGSEIMTSLALKACGGEQLQTADMKVPHNSA